MWQRAQLIHYVGAVLVVVAATVGCSPHVSRHYYDHHPRSARDVTADWGEPVSVTPLEGGLEQRVYAIQSPYTDLKYRYFLIDNGMVVASGLTDRSGREQDRGIQPSVDIAASDLSRAFYEAFPTPVEHLDRTWGEALKVKQMPDGAQFRVYAVNDPYTDFRYRWFMVEDGKVVASRLSPHKGFSDEPSNQPAGTIAVNELSRFYYRNHPMSLQALKQVWGAPITIEKGEGGRQKWVYKLKMPVDAGFGFRFFVIENGRVVSSGVSDTVDMAAATTD